MIYQMGEHCWKPVLCCSLGYNHYPNGFVSDEFRYGCSYKTKSWKRIYFISFLTEILKAFTAMQCGCVTKEAFVYLFIEKNRSACGLN